MNKIKLGCYDDLAKSYSKFRPSYSDDAIQFLKILVNNKRDQCLDIGAGTGIFSRKLTEIFKKVYAVEISKSMIREGKKIKNKKIVWINSSAEKVKLKKKTFNLVTSASCFHWLDNKKIAKKILPFMEKNSYFFIIYNSRNRNFNKFSKLVEKKLGYLDPSFLKKRVSSGQSPKTLIKIKEFAKISRFTQPLIFNLKHTENFSKKKYIGAWISSNEVRARLGDKKFKIFIDWLNNKLKPKDTVTTEYINTCFLLQKNY